MKMVKVLSNNFKKLFLLHFTRELILHSSSGEFTNLQSLMKEEVAEDKSELMRSIKINSPQRKQELVQEDLDFHKIFRGISPSLATQRKTISIPEINLPPHLQYLKPIPKETGIDLEKLNPLINDPAVKIIECSGADEHVFVRGGMGTKPTNIVLHKEDIDKIIETFARVSSIPPHEGIYHVAFGKLILSAIISNVVGSKFMIKKIPYTSYSRRQIYPQPMRK